MDLTQNVNESHAAVVKRIVDYCATVLPHIPALHPFYTLHDHRHCLAVAELCLRIIDSIGLRGPDAIIKPPLTEPELFRIICAALLHDTGMLFAKDDDIAISNGDLNILSDLLRKDHNDRSVEFINQNLNWIDEEEREDICDLANAHRGTPIIERTNLNQKMTPHPTAHVIRLDLLASILRIADELDITNHRAPKEIYNVLSHSNLMPPEASFHWLKHSAVDFISFRTSKNEMSGNFCHVDFAIRANDENYFQWVAPVVVSGLVNELHHLNTVFNKYNFQMELGNIRYENKGCFDISINSILKFWPNLKLALIDDDHDTVETLTRLLHATIGDNFELTPLEPDCSLDELDKFDLLFLDIVIYDDPEGGFKILQEIRNINQDTSIILFTKIDCANDIVKKGLEKGASGYIYRLSRNLLEEFSNTVLNLAKAIYYNRYVGNHLL